MGLSGFNRMRRRKAEAEPVQGSTGEPRSDESQPEEQVPAGEVESPSEAATEIQEAEAEPVQELKKPGRKKSK